MAKEDMFGNAGDEFEEPAIEEEAQEPEATPEEPAEQQDAPVEEQPSGNVETPAPKPEPGFVPFAAVLDERDRRKTLEAEIERMKAQVKPAPVEVPDVFQDPEAYTAHLERQFENKLYQQQLAISRRFAEQQHGAEQVNEAIQWAHAKCEADPYFNEQVRNSGDPVGYAMTQYQRDQIASNVTPDDYKAFQAWRAAQQNQQPQAASPQMTAHPAPVPASPPPKSLVAAQSAGSPTPPKDKPEEQRLNAMFGE